MYHSDVTGCRNLTEEDAPDHGGLVCHWNDKNVQCKAVCKEGFSFSGRQGTFEICGPTTDYVWTFQKRNPHAKIPACKGNKI